MKRYFNYFLIIKGIRNLPIVYNIIHHTFFKILIFMLIIVINSLLAAILLYEITYTIRFKLEITKQFSTRVCGVTLSSCII